MSHKDKSSERRKALYSEEFQEMLDRLEEEDYVDRNGMIGMKKSRLCLEKVKALEKHFEEENKLQPDRKMKIAQEVGLEPRQVAIWFQNRRARSKTKLLEKDYDRLRSSYDALKHDYGSLEQEKLALLNQLTELKAKIEGRNIESSSSPSIIASTHSNDVSNYTTCTTTPLRVWSTSCSSMLDEFQVSEVYEEELMRMEEVGMLSSCDTSCNFFSSVDQPPSLHYWQHATNHFN